MNAPLDLPDLPLASPVNPTLARTPARGVPADDGPVAEAAGCFHCGLPLAPPPSPLWQVVIDGVPRPMCCPGCQAVAQAIADHCFDDYYDARTAFSATGGPALIPPELKLYDAPEAVSAFVVDGDSSEAGFAVDGIRCAACVWLIEKRLRQVPGLLRADMNVATERLHVRWAQALCKPSDILTALHQIGYAAYPFDAQKHGEQLRRASKRMFRQLFIAGLSMMQVMMYALPLYIADEGSMEADMAGLMRWAGLLLTLPAVLYSAQPFFAGAWLNLKNRVLGMDVPVVLGISAAFVGSVIATVRGRGDVYFDSVTMFIFLLLCSRYLELGARRQAAATLERLQYALPAAASRLTGYPAGRAVEIVAAAALAEGDFILVKPGDALATDGVIVEGESNFDVSLLTGESCALYKTVGDFLPGGALNAGQAVVARVTKPARDSTLSVLMKMIERAGQGKPRLSLWADQVAAWFVAVLLVFALLVFIYWYAVDPARAWPIAIAVLAVSCPCALSLATPSALAATTDRLLRQGVLVVQPHVLETLTQVTHVIFDKTGTLTSGKPVLRRTVAVGSMPGAHCLRIAAALEASNAHPLSAAIVTAAHGFATLPSALVAQDLHYVVGQGVEGIVQGVRYRLGRAAFVQALTGSVLVEQVDADLTPVYLGSSVGWLARFELADPVRADARQVVAYFQGKGKTVILLSGDRQTVARHLGGSLGIGAADAYGDYLPDQKLAFVQNLQGQGAVVAMVGDGINDAAALRAANISFTMGSGAPLAQAQADAVLLSGRLSAVPDADRAAARTMAVIRQNLAWATLYNLVAIPAAAFGMLNPWMSGIGMSLSSAVVVINALRLRRAARVRSAAVLPELN
jgi:Cu2+-exporting ATPase